MFCPKCGSLLKVKDGKTSCSCGYAGEKASSLSETIRHEERGASATDQENLFATERHVCPKCGHDKAVLVPPPAATRETWNSSEGDRSSYVCGKCGYKDFID